MRLGWKTREDRHEDLQAQPLKLQHLKVDLGKLAFTEAERELLESWVIFNVEKNELEKAEKIGLEQAEKWAGHEDKW